jgi:Uma2 family endonuclease
MASDLGVRLERDPDTVREPDIAFISAERLPLDADVPGYLELVPDLVVEVASPSDSRRDIREKALMWLEYGVQLVWVPFTVTRTVEVFCADSTMFMLNEDDALDGGDVLPGFVCRVSEIFTV